MASKKPRVIEALFEDSTRWNGTELIRPMVTLEEVRAEINVFNTSNPNAKTPLSSRNPANFIKDLIKKTGAADRNWPPAILLAGYTAIQRTGDGNCFEFIRLPVGQTNAFTTEASACPQNPALTKLAVVQTLSLDRMNKALARHDENWLQSLAISLHILPTHLALHPQADLAFRQVGHMQSNLKLRKAELDGLYYGYLDGGKLALITMEVKGFSSDIIESQIINQLAAIQTLPKVKTLLKSMGVDPIDTIVMPMAMKLVDISCASSVPGSKEMDLAGKKLLYLIDYGALSFSAPTPTGLTVRAETLFDMRPTIKGLNS